MQGLAPPGPYTGRMTSATGFSGSCLSRGYTRALFLPAGLINTRSVSPAWIRHFPAGVSLKKQSRNRHNYVGWLRTKKFENQFFYGAQFIQGMPLRVPPIGLEFDNSAAFMCSISHMSQYTTAGSGIVNWRLSY